MTWNIYNLETPLQSFRIADYLFTKVADYETLTESIFRKAGERILSNGEWLDFPDEVPGSNVVTYTAEWVSSGIEPASTIHKDAKRIHDILILMTLWWGKRIFTGDRPFAISQIYYGDKYFARFNDLVNAIENTLNSIPNHDEARNTKIYPIIFLLIESYQTEIREIQTLTISPIFDLISNHAIQPHIDEFSTEEKKAIKDKRKEISKLLSDQSNKRLFDDVYGPAMSSLGNMGKKMADKLYWLLSDSPALQSMGIPLNILKSQAKAFNMLRNAVVHGYILPDKIVIEFVNRDPVTIEKDADYNELELAAIFMTQIFRDIIYLHITKSYRVDSDWGEHRFRETIKNYFYDGNYNDSEWLE